MPVASDVSMVRVSNNGAEAMSLDVDTDTSTSGCVLAAGELGAGGVGGNGGVLGCAGGVLGVGVACEGKERARSR